MEVTESPWASPWFAGGGGGERGPGPWICDAFPSRSGGHRINGQSRLERHLAGYESSSTLLTSELETTSLCDSEDDDAMSR